MSPSENASELPQCQVSKRAEVIKPFFVMEIMRAAIRKEEEVLKAHDADRQRVLHLEVGQPSTPPPKPVLDVIASPSQPFGYTSALGTQSLREAISCHYDKWYDVSVPASSIAVTTGASGAFLAVFTTCFDAGDRVAVAIPGYPCYRNVLTALSVEVVPIPVDSSTNYQPTISQLRQALPLAGIIIASPANPTGSIIKERELAEIVAFCREHTTRLIVDEIYHGVGPLPKTAMAYDDVVVINSFSKYWCMTGFRIGWFATRDISMIEAAERCVQSFSICAPSFSQYAAEKALDDECKEELEKHVARYRRNQNVLVDRLVQCGFETAAPDGAFYVWAKCDNACRNAGMKNSVELCHALLSQTSVAVTPGLDFDPDRGDHFLRFSCAGTENDIAEAAQRIYDFCSG